MYHVVLANGVLENSVAPKLAQSGSLALGGNPDMSFHMLGAIYGAKLDYATAHDGQKPPPDVVNSWRSLQASHRLGELCFLRRNFNLDFMTLEKRWANEARKACAGAMIERLAGGMSLPYTGTAARDRLVESQATGSRQQTGDLSFTEGDIMLSKLMAEEEEVEGFGKIINTDMCSKMHPRTPRRFWHHSYGAVPEAVTRLPFNELVLCRDLMK